MLPPASTIAPSQLTHWTTNLNFGWSYALQQQAAQHQNTYCKHFVPDLLPSRIALVNLMDMDSCQFFVHLSIQRFSSLVTALIYELVITNNNHLVINAGSPHKQLCRVSLFLFGPALPRHLTSHLVRGLCFQYFVKIFFL